MSLRPLYLLDTNICLYLMKHQPPQVAERFARCLVGEVLISAITAAELEVGVIASGDQAEHNRLALQRFLLEVPVAPFDGRAAGAYRPMRLASRERRRDALDKLIAAHALALGVTLVTNNLADFRIYPGLDVENWVAEAGSGEDPQG
ncbi:type II toxin-antitoxin system VapC family toxin [Synechococcus sp. ATX 2A4]|uniref:type II toxin-antitoxin system VapC family toxin n=1 Tax=Synechococcus sp. ATX 2A4 TaxID=2823727 RepID=UPI0020CEAAEE|nr:type II toxin-antitoxin system VapC family toxin [Synechococcus sp. ATX 2A4]MCP9884635.1 type II toxin-antitoxin system VapC family toxin [Synechococcus sp. ATX 2A4]